METSDDPVTAVVVTGAALGGMQLAKTAGGGSPHIPAYGAGQAVRTAEKATEPESESLRKKRAGLLLKDYDLNLSKPGLLGIPGD